MTFGLYLNHSLGHVWLELDTDLTLVCFPSIFLSFRIQAEVSSYHKTILLVTLFGLNSYSCSLSLSSVNDIDSNFSAIFGHSLFFGIRSISPVFVRFLRYSFISYYSPVKYSVWPAYQWTLHYWFQFIQYHHSSFFFLFISHLINWKAYSLVLSSCEWKTQQCNLVLERTYFMYKARPNGPLNSSINVIFFMMFVRNKRCFIITMYAFNLIITCNNDRLTLDYLSRVL